MTITSETTEPFPTSVTAPSVPSDGDPAVAPPAQDTAVTSVGILGAVDKLSEVEQAKFAACETVIAKGWNGFVDVGLALGEIRDAQLYRVDYDNFEAYCRARWGYGRHYANRLVLAAQVVSELATKCHQRPPDNEAQVRPLIGLTPDQVQLAWECAVQMAGRQRITERIVKSAIEALEIKPKTETAAPLPKLNRATQCRLIQDAFGELLVLLSQKAAHDLLTEKVESLHAHVQLFVLPGHSARAIKQQC